MLLRAVRVVARVRCASPDAYRALFRKLKFRRLLHRITPLEDGWYEGRVGIKFGPLGMKFSGKAKLEKEPDGTWKMHGEGRDRRIGAGVNADVIAHLTESTPGTTEVLVNADLNFSGRLAEMGQPLIRKKSDSMVAEFARREVDAQAAEYDAKGVLNVALFRKLGDLGLLGITVPEEDGGAGMDALAAVIVHHELAKYDPGFTLAFLAHSMLFVNNFHNSSNAAQRNRYLPKALSGEWIGGMGMTEPGAGTDVLGMTTTAVRDREGYVLNGTKTYITNGCEGFCFLVYAKLDGRITSFVVDRDCPGFSTSNHIDKLGMRGSTMAELIFEDCRVPAGNLLGAVGGGVVHMMRNLEIERLTLAAMSVGIAERCVEIMVRYAVERRTFGQPLAAHGRHARRGSGRRARTRGRLGGRVGDGRGQREGRHDGGSDQQGTPGGLHGCGHDGERTCRCHGSPASVPTPLGGPDTGR